MNDRSVSLRLPIGLAVVTLAATGWASGLGMGWTVQETAEELHRQGLAAFEADDHDEAITLLEKSIGLDGDNAAVWNDLGRVHYALESYERAVDHHAKASELEPENENYWFRQGIAYIELNDFDSAQKRFETVLEMNPSHRDSWNDLGFVFNRIGEYETAIPHFDKTIEIDPDIANPRAHRGFAYVKLGKMQEAEADLRYAQELNAEYDKNYFYWACFYATRGDTDAALAHLETAVEKGFKWPDWIDSETSLESLRTTNRYAAVLKRAHEN